jgi:hypothetical protein
MTHATAKSTTQEPPQEMWRWSSRPMLGNWKFWLVIAATALIAGAAVNWSWLVAVGLAPLLLTLLPCAVMCALGLCMHRGAKDGCHGSPAEAPARAPQGDGGGRST